MNRSQRSIPLHYHTTRGAASTYPRAFTLVEMLTVLGIIMILIAISVMGLRHLNRNARNQATKVALEQCRSMLAEYEVQNNANGGVTGLNGVSAYTDVTSNPATAPSGIVDVNMGTNDRAFVATAAIMAQMANYPTIRKMMDNIPAGNFFVNSSGQRTNILLDGWGNPMLFVPGGGLSGVTTGGSTVTVYAPDAANGKQSGHPWFASAGEDNQFNKGDDNIYSWMAN